MACLKRLRGSLIFAVVVGFRLMLYIYGETVGLSESLEFVFESFCSVNTGCGRIVLDNAHFEFFTCG